LDAAQIVIAIFTALLAVIGYLIKLAIGRVIAASDKLETKIDDANAQLSTLQGSIHGIKIWQSGHEGRDDERHQENLHKFDLIFEAMSERE